MKIAYTYIFFSLGVIILLGSSCTKDALDKKSDIRQAVPSTIGDYQQMLDGIAGSGGTAVPVYLTLGSYMSDDVIMPDGTYTSSPLVVQGIYTWNKEMFANVPSLIEWDDQYRVIMTANFILEGINKITPDSGNLNAWNNVAGSALMIRGNMFLDLATFWAQPYQSASASTDLGIVLRTQSDITIKAVRSSVLDTYTQIISDLKAAAAILPNTSSENTVVSKARPSKAAAYGLLARTYLAMGDSVNVEAYADSALQLYSTLLDYNAVLAAGGISANQNYGIYNSEMLYLGNDNGGGTGGYNFNYNIDTALVQSYDANDLRGQLFFYNNGSGYGWNGDYTTDLSFTGLANDELYLLRAEANARLGNTADAMNDLNTLLVTRWVTGTYVPKTAASASDALTQILTERRKELVMRGTRWPDLRRLNTDTRFAKTLTRVIAGTTYTLPANDSRYTLQIPAYIIAANGIQQNP